MRFGGLKLVIVYHGTHRIDYGYAAVVSRRLWLSDRRALYAATSLSSWQTSFSSCVLLQSPAYRSSDSGRLLYFGRDLSFSHHRFFDILGQIFAKPCHTTRCVLKYFISYMGVYTCPLKIWGAKTPNFCRFADPKYTLWAPPFPNAGKIRKSKTVKQ